MAVPYLGHLAARLRARFHVQVQVKRLEDVVQTPAAVPTKGRVVRVFRSDGTLKVGDDVVFSEHVRRPGDDIWTGPSFMLYQTYIQANYMEVFLNGPPPRCEVALDECIALNEPTPRPRLRASRLAYLVEVMKWKFLGRGAP